MMPTPRLYETGGTRDFAPAPAPRRRRPSAARPDRWKLRPTEPLTVLFDDLDFSFTRKEIVLAQYICKTGGDARAVAEALGRDEWEAFLLCCWLWREGRV